MRMHCCFSSVEISVDHDRNLCESSVKVISLQTICMKREMGELQFSPFLVILSEKLANISMISHEITCILRERAFTT